LNFPTGYKLGEGYDAIPNRHTIIAFYSIFIVIIIIIIITVVVVILCHFSHGWSLRRFVLLCRIEDYFRKKPFAESDCCMG